MSKPELAIPTEFKVRQVTYEFMEWKCPFCSNKRSVIVNPKLSEMKNRARMLSNIQRHLKGHHAINIELK
jgi:hypothetical protein